jgi:Lipid A 3-O-deacylase (PagL)
MLGSAQRRAVAAIARRHVIWSCGHHARWLSIACVLLLGSEPALAQSGGDNPWFVRGGITPAFVISTNPFVSGGDETSGRTDVNVIDRAPNVTLEVGRRTNGSSSWHELYGMPSYGFGFSLASFRNGVEHARPVEAYGFFSWPFYSFSDRLDVTTDFGMGVSWNWKRVNDRSGATDTVLGSNLNARIDWGFYLRYLMTPRQVLYVGGDFTHRSNGGVVQPDIGINTIGPKVMLQYNFGEFGFDVPSSREARPPSHFQPSWEAIAGASGGLKNVVLDTGSSDFKSIDMTAGALRRFYPYGELALGTDVIHDGSVGPIAHDGPWALGMYAGYEHLIGRFSAFVHVGYTVARGLDDPDAPRAYQRFGWRYQVTDRIFGTFAVRATGGNRAEALEVGAGYRMRWPFRM